MNKIKEVQRINNEELKRGTIGGGAGSWHSQYKDSSYVFAGGLDYGLTEGDLLCVFSQFGEIEDINLVRAEDTGKSKGFCFVKFEDQRSTVLAVDNFNGMELCGRQVHIDHVLRYKLPKHLQDKEDEADAANAGDGGHYGPGEDANSGGGGGGEGGSKYVAGHAYKGKELASKYDIGHGVDLYAKQPEGEDEEYELLSDQENGGGGTDDSDDSESERPAGSKRSKREKPDEHGKKAKKAKKTKEEKKHKKEKKEKKEKKRQRHDLSADLSVAEAFAEGSGSTAAVAPLLPLPFQGAATGVQGSGGGGGGGDDSWRGRMAARVDGDRGGGKGGGGHAAGQHVGGFGSSSGKGSKLMGPKFGGGGGGGSGGKGGVSAGKGGSGKGGGNGKGGGGKGGFDGGTYGGMNRLR